MKTYSDLPNGTFFRFGHKTPMHYKTKDGALELRTGKIHTPWSEAPVFLPEDGSTKGTDSFQCAQCSKRYRISEQAAKIFLRARRWVCDGCLMESLDKFMSAPLEEKEEPA